MKGEAAGIGRIHVHFTTKGSAAGDGREIVVKTTREPAASRWSGDDDAVDIEERRMACEEPGVIRTLRWRLFVECDEKATVVARALSSVLTLTRATMP